MVLLGCFGECIYKLIQIILKDGEPLTVSSSDTNNKQLDTSK